jgi:hypothetical protein
VRSGMDRAGAERSARIEFGGREKYREEIHATVCACCASLPDSPLPLY